MAVAASTHADMGKGAIVNRRCRSMRSYLFGYTRKIDPTLSCDTRSIVIPRNDRRRSVAGAP